MGVKDSSASGTIMTPGPRCVCAPGATHTQLNEGLLTTLLDEVVLERVAVLIFVALELFFKPILVFILLVVVVQILVSGSTCRGHACTCCSINTSQRETNRK